MAASSAVTGKGTILSISDTIDGTYTAVAEIKDVNIPGITVGTYDVTHYTSDDNTIEKIPGDWEEGDVIPFVGNFTPTQYQTLLGKLRLRKFYKVTLVSGAYWKGPATLTKLGGNSIPNKGSVDMPGEITPLGKWESSATAEA
jgi:hypothetical protein